MSKTKGRRREKAISHHVANHSIVMRQLEELIAEETLIEVHKLAPPPLELTWCEEYLLRADPTFDIRFHRELFFVQVPQHLTRRDKAGLYEQFCNDRFWQLMRDKQG